LQNYRKGSHTVYDLKYHIVWITKYRKPVMRGDIAVRVRDLIREISRSLDVEIMKGHVAADHVHLFVSIPPRVSISDYVKAVKGKSSRKLLSEYRRLSKVFWGRHIWARGYFVASSGNVTDEVVEEYIRMQQDVEGAHGDDFTIAEK
jgi:putative transposase